MLVYDWTCGMGVHETGRVGRMGWAPVKVTKRILFLGTSETNLSQSLERETEHNTENTGPYSRLLRNSRLRKSEYS